MERSLGRDLEPGERVHHLNGDRADNRPENLVLCPSQREHLRVWHPDIVAGKHLSRGTPPARRQDKVVGGE
ncbi:MAG: HNH endonuclease [Candidatus Dormibacteria bacterium]